MTSSELARGWITAWAEKDYQWLRHHLADNFSHSSPFGSLSGCDHYLSVVIPMSEKSVQQLTVKHVVADGPMATVWFENQTPAGPIPSCDWITTENGKIAAVQSFYDTAKVREVLSDAEQSRLDDN